MTPYTDNKVTDNSFQRVFESNTDNTELVWHRDHTDRTVVIQEGQGWRLQMDNSLPQTLEPGDVVTIPANTYHRIIKGSTNLKVEITEHEPDNNQHPI